MNASFALRWKKHANYTRTQKTGVVYNTAMFKKILIPLFLLVILTACSPASAPVAVTATASCNIDAACAAPVNPSAEPLPTLPAAGPQIQAKDPETLPSAPAGQPKPVKTELPRLAPTAGTLTPLQQEGLAPVPQKPAGQAVEWQTLPVLPTLSPRALEIIKDGLARGNNPYKFSKVGDCESRTTWYLADFDDPKKPYRLGPYSELQPTLDHFAGSFGRLSLAAKPGFTAASLLSPLWSDREVCDSNESPLACEYRIQKPIVALITLGTNDASRPETFEENLRKVIDFTLAQDILPVLATKADNLEGNHANNAVIARLAQEYDLPLWNFWAAVQGLPDQGLQEDGAHLTWYQAFFDDPEAMKRAWPVRNLTALQILDAVRLTLE